MFLGLINSLVSELGGDEEESCLEDVHGGGHGGRVEVLELDLCHLEEGESIELSSTVTSYDSSRPGEVPLSDAIICHFVQSDTSRWSKPPVDLDLRCSVIQPGQ